MRRAGTAIAEQGIWSLGSFVVSAFVGRALGIADFGLFSVAMVALYGVGGVLNSLVVDPASIVGPRYFDDHLRRYGGLVVGVSAAFGGFVALVGLVIVLTSGGGALASVGAGLVLAFPTFVSWAMRRLPYLTEQPGAALIGSIVYAVGSVGGLIALDLRGRLSVSTALAALGVAASAHAVVMVGLWRPVWAGIRDRAMARRARLGHWEYGRWFIATEASSWILNYGFAGLSAGALSLETAGGYRAGQVILRPYGVVFQGLGLYLLPRYTRTAVDRGIVALTGTVRSVGLLLMGFAATAWVVMLVWGDGIMSLAFGPDFARFGGLAAAMTGAMTIHAWIVASSMALQAAGHPRDVFFGQLASAVVSLAGGLWLGLTWGVDGLIVALWLATAARAAVVATMFRRRVREAKSSGSHPAAQE
ncbi:MAG TPA: hypothetical protein VLB67_02280 [Acidimicrobiia bacterium]|nr:hypothetical protein [Acidimicrobiia bacterium]